MFLRSTTSLQLSKSFLQLSSILCATLFNFSTTFCHFVLHIFLTTLPHLLQFWKTHHLNTTCKTHPCNFSQHFSTVFIQHVYHFSQTLLYNCSKTRLCNLTWFVARQGLCRWQMFPCTCHAISYEHPIHMVESKNCSNTSVQLCKHLSRTLLNTSQRH